MRVNQIENGLDLTKVAQNIEAIYDTTLEPGKGIDLHFHPDLEEIYYVLPGYGTMTIGEEKQKISRYDVSESERDKEFIKESFKQKKS